MSKSVKSVQSTRNCRNPKRTEGTDRRGCTRAIAEVFVGDECRFLGHGLLRKRRVELHKLFWMGLLKLDGAFGVGATTYVLSGAEREQKLLRSHRVQLNHELITLIYPTDTVRTGSRA